ncbi:MAG: methylisocitrate lyase [Limnohabitans sp.]|nr:methylisocitrate lyase [Limnohabitans sp.]
MTRTASAGARFRAALTIESPLQIIGTSTAYHALMASKVGFRALYLSGGALAAGALGVPDLGISNLADVLIDAQRITAATDVPLLVDVDTGFGPSSLNMMRTVKSMIQSGVAAIHIEDQVALKRAPSRGKVMLVPLADMVDRIKAAVDAKTDPDFVIVARTDAIAVEGLQATLDRASACVEAGADMVIPEALPELAMYKMFVEACKVPIIAGIPEFGKAPIFTREELQSVDVSMVLYPLSAFHAANAAALNVFRTIRSEGTQKSVVSTMQTREELYEYLGYLKYEQQLDAQRAKVL